MSDLKPGDRGIVVVSEEEEQRARERGSLAKEDITSNKSRLQTLENFLSNTQINWQPNQGVETGYRRFMVRIEVVYPY